MGHIKLIIKPCPRSAKLSVCSSHSLLLKCHIFFLESKSFLMSFCAACYATPSPAGTGGGHGISNLLFSCRHPNWKSCLEHMARVTSQEKNKGQRLPCVPSQSGQAFWLSRGSRQCKTLNGGGSAGREHSHLWQALGTQKGWARSVF